MAHFSHAPFQAALYQKLHGDATLMALITGVYDFIPQGAAYPYVAIGEAQGRDWSTKSSSGMQYSFAVRVFAREAGRKQAATVMERVHTLLHTGSLTITGQTLISLRCESSEILLQDDGLTYQGVLRFRALIEAS